MAQRLEDLVVRISGDTASLNRSVAHASRQIDGFSRSASRSFAGLGSSIRAAAGALAAFGAATQLKAAVQSSIALADSLANTAERVGTTAEALQRLRAAADPAGIGASKLDAALLRLSKNLGEAQNGAGSLVTALEGSQDALLESLRGADNSAEAYLRLADGIARIASPTEQARVATAALGRAGTEQLGVLKQGREALEAYGDTAQRAGAIVSNEAVAALDDFGDSLGRITNVALAQFTEGIAESVTGAESLTAVLADENRIRAIGDLARGIGELAGSIAAAGAEAASWIAPVSNFLDILRTPPEKLPGRLFGPDFDNVSGGSSSAIAKAARREARTIPASAGAPRRRSASLRGGGGRSARGVEPDLSQLDTSRLLRGPLDSFIEGNARAMAEMDELVRRTTESTDAALAQTERRAEVFGDFMGSLVGNFVNGADTEWKRLATSFIASIAEMEVAALASDLFKWFNRATGGATAKADSGDGADSILGGLLGSLLGGATPLARGGLVTRPTLALIGEAGPEAVLPLRNFSAAGTVVNVNNYGADVDVRRRRGSAGEEIDIIVEQSWKRGASRGAFRGPLEQRHRPGVG